MIDEQAWSGEGVRKTEKQDRQELQLQMGWRGELGFLRLEGIIWCARVKETRCFGLVNLCHAVLVNVFPFLQKYLRSCQVPGTILGSGDGVASKKAMIPTLMDKQIRC